jgi:two-component system alkaline phosphatase synthesis response regulator PhoP
MNGSILVVEDDDTLRTALGDRLRGEKYTVETARDAEEAMEKVSVSPFDLLIIDVMLPYRDGFDLCRCIRQSGMATSILFLTARTSLLDKLTGFKLGGDDYLTKPFEAEELTARVEALLRRLPGNTGSGTHMIGPLRVDVAGREVTRDGNPLPLTSREFHLLCYLIERAGQTVPRSELLRAVWGYESGTYSRTVDVHISTLRKKIETDPSQPSIIRTVIGTGYKLVRH